MTMDFGSGSSRGSNINKPKQPSLVTADAAPKPPKLATGVSPKKATRVIAPKTPKDFDSVVKAKGSSLQHFYSSANRTARGSVSGSKTKRFFNRADGTPSVTSAEQTPLREHVKNKARHATRNNRHYLEAAGLGAAGTGYMTGAVLFGGEQEGDKHADTAIRRTQMQRKKKARQGEASKALAVEAVRKFTPGMDDKQTDRQGMLAGGIAAGLAGGGSAVMTGMDRHQRRAASKLRDARDEGANQWFRAAKENPSMFGPGGSNRSDLRDGLRDLHLMDIRQREMANNARMIRRGRNAMVGMGLAAIPASVAGNRRAKRKYEQRTGDWLKKNPAPASERRVIE